ncbi:MAG TPA: tetratricopeptide repeat protein [Candidatus Saccharimonadales bacterium]|nr:tetratricopeptide repeat protein [Candidatus Saccharimonadales bacterium]
MAQRTALPLVGSMVLVVILFLSTTCASSARAVFLASAASFPGENNRSPAEWPRAEVSPPDTQDHDPDQLLELARSLLKDGHASDAEKQVRAHLQLKPDSAKGHYLLGLILFKQGKAVESLAEYTEAAKYQSPSSQDLKIVALDYVLLGNFAEADNWLTRATIWNPRDAEAWYHLGRTKYNESHFARAVSAFQRCLELDPVNIKAEANLGLSLAALGRSAEAEKSYRNAISWQSAASSKVAEPYIDLGALLLDQNRDSDALPLLLQADAISPEDSRVPELLGKTYWRQNNLTEAQLQLEKAINLAKDNPANHYLLAQVYRKQGMAEKAKTQFELAATLIASQRTAPK